VSSARAPHTAVALSTSLVVGHHGQRGLGRGGLGRRALGRRGDGDGGGGGGGRFGSAVGGERQGEDEGGRCGDAGEHGESIAKHGRDLLQRWLRIAHPGERESGGGGFLTGARSAAASG
jgi:hypothetical protein